MQEPSVYRRNFLLHLQKRSGHRQKILIKEPANDDPPQLDPKPVT